MNAACDGLGSDLELRVQPLNGSPVSEDAQRRLLRLIEANPGISQREPAYTMGVSLGKANYCIKALVNKGFVKQENFRRHGNKLAYAYLLTPAGLEEKRPTSRWLIFAVRNRNTKPSSRRSFACGRKSSFPRFMARHREYFRV